MQLEPAQRLAGVYRLHFEVHADTRGAFFEAFRVGTCAPLADWGDLLQVNMSHSEPGVIRGLHYQRAPFAQGKVVMCLQGEIRDVVLDLRPDSATYGQWEAFTLKDAREGLVVPPGCAHGFEALGASNWVQYFVFCAPYHPEAESGIAYNDPALAIPWQTAAPILSEKDQRWPNVR